MIGFQCARLRRTCRLALFAILAMALSPTTSHALALARGGEGDWAAICTPAGVQATGMFAQITSPAGGKLVSASSPVAGVVEIHEMAMEGNVMNMRGPANGLDLPAVKSVGLKPGGYHVMLMDLKKDLKARDMVPVTLVIEGA